MEALKALPEEVHRVSSPMISEQRCACTLFCLSKLAALLPCKAGEQLKPAIISFKRYCHRFVTIEILLSQVKSHLDTFICYRAIVVAELEKGIHGLKEQTSRTIKTMNRQTASFEQLISPITHLSGKIFPILFKTCC